MTTKSIKPDYLNRTIPPERKTYNKKTNYTSANFKQADRSDIIDIHIKTKNAKYIGLLKKIDSILTDKRLKKNRSQIILEAIYMVHGSLVEDGVLEYVKEKYITKELKALGPSTGRNMWSILEAELRDKPIPELIKYWNITLYQFQNIMFLYYISLNKKSIF